MKITLKILCSFKANKEGCYIIKRGTGIDKGLFLLEPSLYKYFIQVCSWSVIEAPFALFQEEVEMFFSDVIISSQMPLRLVLKVLNYPSRRCKHRLPGSGLCGCFSRQTV